MHRHAPSAGQRATAARDAPSRGHRLPPAQARRAGGPLRRVRRRRKTYLIDLLDDATRVVPHAAFAETAATFLPGLQQAVQRRGLPSRLPGDNGAHYRSRQLAVTCAKLEVHLIHARPYQPVGKGKIERFFRTVRAQFRAHLEQADTRSLATLNNKLGAWLEGAYHQSHTAAWTGARRWTSGPRRRKTCAAPTRTGSSASATST